MILLIQVKPMFVSVVLSFKFQSDSINTRRTRGRLTMASYFKFQSDSINTTDSLISLLTISTLNSNLILLILEREKRFNQHMDFKFQSDSINTFRLSDNLYLLSTSLNSNLILLIRFNSYRRNRNS